MEKCACAVVGRSSSLPMDADENSALINAGENGGQPTRRRSSARAQLTMKQHAHTAEKHLLHTEITSGAIAAMTAISMTASGERKKGGNRISGLRKERSL